MKTKFALASLIAAAGFLPIFAAPKPKDKVPAEKELKAFASKVVTLLIKKDIDGFLGLCDFPFHQPGGFFSKEKDELRNWITKAVDAEPLRAGVNEVKKVETFEAAKSRFTKAEVKSIEEVLADGDFVVHVKTEFGLGNQQLSLLVKVKDGKPRLAGWGRAAEVPGQ